MPIIFKGHNEDEEPMDLVATHQRSLIAACLRTTNPIVELGVGWYSTPLIHEIANAQKRLAITLDNNWDWLAQFMSLNCDYHKVQLVDWWGDIGNLRLPFEIGVLFVDNGQPAEREYLIRHFLNKHEVDVFVMHDTEEMFAYGYSRTLNLFKYKWTDKCQKAHTTIASNNIDVRNWMTELPPVEPTKEIT